MDVVEGDWGEVRIGKRGGSDEGGKGREEVVVEEEGEERCLQRKESKPKRQAVRSKTKGKYEGGRETERRTKHLAFQPNFQSNLSLARSA